MALKGSILAIFQILPYSGVLLYCSMTRVGNAQWKDELMITLLPVVHVFLSNKLSLLYFYQFIYLGFNIMPSNLYIVTGSFMGRGN